MSTIRVDRPDTTEYSDDFGKYIRLVPEGDIREFLDTQLTELLQLLSALSDYESLAHHAPYTWSIKQVIGHMTDCERVFGYRALRIARNDPTPLPSFDEQLFMRNVNFDRYPLEELLREFELMRRSHILMFRHLEADAWTRVGNVGGNPLSTRALAYAIAGHAKHHLEILRKRLGR